MEKALGELELRVLEGRTTKDALAATLVARDAADKEIVVKLKSTVSGTTTISVRVGTFGNEGRSQQIYDRIRENLREKGDRRPDRRSGSVARARQTPASGHRAMVRVLVKGYSFSTCFFSCRSCFMISLTRHSSEERIQNSKWATRIWAWMR